MLNSMPHEKVFVLFDVKSPKILLFFIFGFCMNISAPVANNGFTLGFWGHRGSETDSDHARTYRREGQQPAENTIAAIEKVLDAGADGVEIDVMATKDGHLVVTHSNDLSKHVFLPGYETHRREGFVSDRTLDELKSITFGAGRNGTIPTLAEVLEWLDSYGKKHQRPVTLNIEIKDVKGTHDAPSQNVVAKVAEAIRKGPLDPHQIVVSSFAQGDLEAMERAQTGVRLGMLFVGQPSHHVERLYPALPDSPVYRAFTPETVREVKRAVPTLYAVHPMMGGVSAQALQAAASEGLAVNPWFSDEPEPDATRAMVAQALAMAAQAGVKEMNFISNFPAELKRGLQQGFVMRGARVAVQEPRAQGPAK